jgi:hypothetical protein
MGHEKKAYKGLEMSLSLKHCFKQEIWPPMGQEKAKWLFKKAWDFEHFSQAIWAIKWAKKKAIKGLKWAWILDITSSKKLGSIMGQEKSHQMAKISLGFGYYLKQEILGQQ